MNQPNGEVWTSPNQTKQGPRERSIKIGELKLGEKDLGGLAVQVNWPQESEDKLTPNIARRELWKEVFEY